MVRGLDYMKNTNRTYARTATTTEGDSATALEQMILTGEYRKMVIANTTKNRTCRICGKKYKGAYNSVLCSTECRREADRRKKSAERKRNMVGVGICKITCVWCEKEFTAKKSTAKYCSQKCMMAYRKAHRKGLPMPNKVDRTKILVDVARQADLAGMSYGQWVAQEYLKAR